MIRAIALAVVIAGPALADPPVIEAVSAASDGNAWRFEVTLRHPDTGWDHYADGWDVIGPEGSVLGSRPLVHPHVNEQPFTRSLSGVAIGEGVTSVTVRARCSVDGWTARPVNVTLER